MPTLNKRTHKTKKITGAHKQEGSGEDWRKGKNANQRGYNYKWQQERKRYLKENPLCKHHEERGKIQLAKVVDHIIDHKGDEVLFWDEENWQGLCITCHNIKTAKTKQGKKNGFN
jgi:5-methylcytosine-specific restriction endonuclease McrA